MADPESMMVIEINDVAEDHEVALIRMINFFFVTNADKYGTFCNTVFSTLQNCCLNWIEITVFNIAIARKLAIQPSSYVIMTLFSIH